MMPYRIPIIMDYSLYVWLRRVDTVGNFCSEFRRCFLRPLLVQNGINDLSDGDGEIIDDSSRFDGDKTKLHRRKTTRTGYGTKHSESLPLGEP